MPERRTPSSCAVFSSEDAAPLVLETGYTDDKNPHGSFMRQFQ